MRMSPALREQRVDQLAHLIREGADYRWENETERHIWTQVAQEFLNEHLDGRKSLVSEACFRAHVNKNDVLLAESAARLNEGFFSGLKDMLGGGLAKTFGKAFGGVKSRNWWIFGGGGDKETAKYRQAYVDATEENQQVFAKLGQTTLKTMVDQIKGVIEDWPNGGSVKEFTDAMAKFDQFYQSVRTAAGADTTDGTPPPQGVAPKLSVEDANAIIKKLRQAMQFFDRELKDRYTYNLESRTRRVPTLVEALLLEAGEDDDIGAEGRKTSGMKGLESNLAPGILAALGLGGIAAGLLAQSDWFIKLTSVMKESPPTEIVQNTTKFVEETLGTVKDGQGWMWSMNNLTPGGPNITGASPMSDVVKKIAMAGGGDFSKGVQAYTSGDPPFLMGGEKTAEMLMKLKDNPNAYGKTMMDLLGHTGTGTGKKIGDLVWVKSGAQLKGLVMKPVQEVIKSAGSKVLTQTALGAKITALGPWGVGIGAGLIAAAASIKALRDYGAKNSRTTYFQAAVDLFKDIKPDEVKTETVPEQPPFVPEPIQPGKVLVTLDNKSTKVVAPGDVVASKGFDIPKAYTLEEIPLNDKDKTKEEVIDYLESPQGKGSVQLADGKSAKDLEGLEFEVTDKRKKSSGSSTDPGKGAVSVVSIKDWKVPRLTTYLFESTDESADVRVAGAEAKKSKTYKELKKKFKNDPKNLPLPLGVSTREDDVIKDTMKLTDDDFDLRATSKDGDVQQGLNALRKKAKSGNVILTFSNKAHEKLATQFQMSEDDIKKLLAIYSKKPESAPKIEAYKSILSKIKDDAKKKELRQFIIDMGMAVSKPKKNEALYAGSESLIIERWSKLAGLL